MSFSAKYWSLAQAKGWVLYRSPKLVDLLEGSDGSELAAAAIYPNLRFTREVDEEFPGERIGSINELLLAFRSGRVTAQGREDGKGRLQEISTAEWVDLDFRRGNDVFRDDGSWWARVVVSASELRAVFKPLDTSSPKEQATRKRGGGRKPGPYRNRLRQILEWYDENQEGGLEGVGITTLTRAVRVRLRKDNVKGVPKSRSGLEDAIRAERRRILERKNRR